MPAILLLPALVIGAGVLQYRKYKWETEGPLHESGWGLRLGADASRVPLSSQAPLLSNDSSSPALYVKVLEVGSRSGYMYSFNHKFFVLKVGSNFTVTSPLGSPELHSSEYRLATMDSAGQLVPRILELYLYGYKASKVRLMGIGRFSVDRIMQSIQIGVGSIQVSVELLHRKGRVATTVLLALRSDECPRAIPYAVVNGGDEKPPKVQETLHASGGPESRYVVISSGGDTAIGVVEEENKVDVVKRSSKSPQTLEKRQCQNP